MNKKIWLIILDWFWINEKIENNSIKRAKTPIFDKLFSENFTYLEASEEFVWLPKWQMWNSEVGHMAIGSWRLLKQPLVEINDLLDTKISRLFTADFISGYSTDAKYASVKDMLVANSVTAWKTTTPTLLIHGTKDTFVPPQVTSRIFQGFLNEGVGVNQVRMLSIPGGTHQTSIVPAGLTAINWFLEIKNED